MKCGESLPNDTDVSRCAFDVSMWRTTESTSTGRFSNLVYTQTPISTARGNR